MENISDVGMDEENTEKHLCSYAGVVPGADNSGEHESKHEHVKTWRCHTEIRPNMCSERSRQNKDRSAIKRIYVKQIKRRKNAQEAE